MSRTVDMKLVCCPYGVPAAAITQVVDIKDATAWFQGALGELSATVSAQGVAAVAPAGGVYSNALFTDAHGEAAVFVPCARPVRAIGAHTNIDIAYGSLATYVSRAGT
jgi:hypothetical protein